MNDILRACFPCKIILAAIEKGRVGFEFIILLWMETTTVIAKNNNSQQIDEENLLEEALGAIEELFEFRLAERLGRFVDK